MTNVTDPVDPPAEPVEEAFPRNWRWDDDGETVAGTFVRFDSGPTRGYGRKPICVLDVGGEERSLWLMQEVLYNRFRDELLERPDRKLVVGERIVATRLAEKASPETGRTYRAFKVMFPDRPETSTDELFGLGDEPPAKQQKQPEAEPDDGDDIPF